MDKFLDFVLRIVSIIVVVALAIPALALVIDLFYRLPIYAWILIMAAILILAGSAYRFFLARR
jgi:hypothetical protein